MRRRAEQPRRLKRLNATASRMIGLAVQLRSSTARPAAAPSAAVLALAAQGKAPASWNRYAASLLRWEEYAARAGTPFLPADPSHFANFLAEAAAGASGHSQTKQRSCAIDALSKLAHVPSPTGDDTVRDVRAGLRCTLLSTRGRVRPIFSYELPMADALPPLPTGRGGGPRRLIPGDAAAPLSVRKRAREQAVRCSAILEAAALRFDDIVEGQIGDAVVHPDLVALTVFGSKTDNRLTGQPAVLPNPADPRSGAHALLESVRLGLTRLLGMEPVALAQLAARFRASLPTRHIGRGAEELSAWPADIRALAGPLYDLGLPVHCLPIYGQWQHERLHGQSDLQLGVERHIFLALSAHALTAVGVAVDGFGGHSFRRGRAVELICGNASRETVTEVLRHRNPASTRPYITDAARMASLAVTMTAATSGRLSTHGLRPAGSAPAAGAGQPPPGVVRPLPGPGRPGLYTAGMELGRHRGMLDPHAPHGAQPLAWGRGAPPPVGHLAAPPSAAVGASLPPRASPQRTAPAADRRPADPAPLRGMPVRPAPGRGGSGRPPLH